MVNCQKVFVAMSGGVDSSVAAALLQRRGFSAKGGPAKGWDVRGVFMRYWGDVDDLVPGGNDFTNCCNLDAMEDAQRVCDHLGIPLTVIDLREEFRQQVVKPFLAGYESGSTPNPCIECNRSIKFELIDRILNQAAAEERGDILFATGHYIRTTASGVIASRSEAIQNDGVVDCHGPAVAGPRNDGERIRLFVADDAHKDQSYFLYTLTQEKLRRLLFPIGEFTKLQVRAMAQNMGLPVALKKESQEVCFIKNNIKDFLQVRIRQTVPGNIVDLQGEVIGCHEGLPFYTLGQRTGLGVGGGGPYYVSAKDHVTNTLVVAKQGEQEQSLYHRCAILKEVNWICEVPPQEPIRVIAKPRYRHPGTPATVTVDREQGTANNTTHCIFDAPERALTPGQSVVFYQDAPEGLELLGGGIISEIHGRGGGPRSVPEVRGTRDAEGAAAKE